MLLTIITTVHLSVYLPLFPPRTFGFGFPFSCSSTNSAFVASFMIFDDGWNRFGWGGRKNKISVRWLLSCSLSSSPAAVLGLVFRFFLVLLLFVGYFLCVYACVRFSRVRECAFCCYYAMFFCVLFFRFELNAIIGIVHVGIVDVGCLDKKLLVVMMQNESHTSVLYEVVAFFHFFCCSCWCWGWEGANICGLTIILL